MVFYIIIFGGLAVFVIFGTIAARSRRAKTMRSEEHHTSHTGRQDRKRKRTASQQGRRKRK